MEVTILDVEQVAQVLCVSPAKIADMKARHKIPFRKLGDRLLFIKEEVLEWFMGGCMAEDLVYKNDKVGESLIYKRGNANENRDCE